MALQEKIVEPDALTDAIASLARPLVFTNGVFDLMHPGHVLYLEEARSKGATLVVGLNSDASARLLEKGADRPINPESDRAIMLAALESVSLVCTFGERTPVDLIGKIKPDIYVKGGDYNMDELQESTLVRSWGGTAMAIPFREGFSTTNLLSRIRTSAP